MFRVEVNNGQWVLDYDENVVTTVLGIVQQFQKDYGFRFAADPLVYDSSQGPTGHLNSSAGSLPYDTVTTGDRTYAMTCWIRGKVDSKGQPVTRFS